jgi:hypothetical protein
MIHLTKTKQNKHQKEEIDLEYIMNRSEIIHHRSSLVWERQLQGLSPTHSILVKVFFLSSHVSG